MASRLYSRTLLLSCLTVFVIIGHSPPLIILNQCFQSMPQFVCDDKQLPEFFRSQGIFHGSFQRFKPADLFFMQFPTQLGKLQLFEPCVMGYTQPAGSVPSVPSGRSCLIPSPD